MRVVTLNTWKNEGDYPGRLALMAAQLRDLEADVICLQECFAGAGADTAARMADELGMTATILPARRKLRLHEGRLSPSTSGLASLTRIRPLGAASLQLTPDHRDGERVALRIDLADDAPLRILNLHLTHLRDGRAAETRAMQFGEALAWAQAGWNGALLVCGDLNAGRGDPELALLESDMGEELGPTLHRAASGGAIDHCVLLQPGPWRVSERFLALQAANQEGLHPSDHAAVVVDLTDREQGVGRPLGGGPSPP